MPVINFVRSKPGSGGIVPATGRFKFTPTKARVIPGDPDETVVPVPLAAPIVAGAVAVNLAPTAPGWAWQVFESVDGIRDETYFVLVPDVPGPLDDADLTRANPSTLSPRAAPEAAWWSVANSTITAAQIVGDDLVLTRHDGTTVNAGNVKVTATELAAAAQAAAPSAALAAAPAAAAAVAQAAAEAVAPAAAAAVAPAAAEAAAIHPPAGAAYVFVDTDGRPYFE